MDRTDPAPPTRSGPQTRIPLLLIAIAVAALVFRLATQVTEKAPASAGEGLVRWQPVESAIKKGTASARPVLYDFTAAWCPPCRLLDSQGWEDAAIATKVSTRFVPARVMDRQREDGKNTDAIAELQHRYRIQAFPTLIVADSSGREIARMEGFGGKDKLEAFLAEALQKAGK